MDTVCRWERCSVSAVELLTTNSSGACCTAVFLRQHHISDAGVNIDAADRYEETALLKAANADQVLPMLQPYIIYVDAKMDSDFSWGGPSSVKLFSRS